MLGKIVRSNAKAIYAGVREIITPVNRNENDGPEHSRRWTNVYVYIHSYQNFADVQAKPHTKHVTENTVGVRGMQLFG